METILRVIVPGPVATCYFEMEDYTNVLLSRPLRKEIFRPYVTTKLTDQYVNNKAFMCVLLISIYMQIQKQSSLKSEHRDILRESLYEVGNCCLRHMAGCGGIQLMLLY